MATRGTRLTAVSLATSVLGAGFALLLAGSASATVQAIANIEYKNTFFVNSYYFAIRDVTTPVTVGTGTGPTPTVMWPASVLKGSTVGFTYSGGMTPSASRNAYYRNRAGQLSKSWAGAAAGPTEPMPRPSATTICFGPPQSPPALPGSCLPRPHKASRVPGAKKYGGTGRMIAPLNIVGLFNAASPPGGYDAFSIMGVPGTDVGLSEITVPGQYGVAARGVFTNTITMGPRATENHVTEAPYTTGTARATTTFLPTPIYMVSVMGENSLDTVNLTGTISVVAPFLVTQYNRDAAGVFAGLNPALALTGARRTTLTFLPEPGAVALLGSGVFTLGALYRRRIKR